MIRVLLYGLSVTSMVGVALAAARIEPAVGRVAPATQVHVAIIARGDIGHYAGMCDARSGSDSLDGTVKLEELDEDGTAHYRGALPRFTEVNACGTRPAPTEDQVKMCVAHLSGEALMDVTIEIYEGDRGAYVKMEPISGLRKQISGCPEPGDWLDSYPDDGWLSGMAFETVPSGELISSMDYNTGATTFRVY